jgi:mannose PTS system EIIA component
MASILIVAHQPLASALRAVALHVYEDCGPRISAVDITADTPPRQIQDQVTQAMLALGSAEVLILTDVFGATPSQAALAAADAARGQVAARVVAGVNVPMLLRTLCYSTASLDDLVDRALAGATQGVMHVTVPRQQNQPHSPSAPGSEPGATPSGSDDQNANHHQQ